jgi:hypothetical protein
MPLGVKNLIRHLFFTELDFTLKFAFFKNQEFQDFLTHERGTEMLSSTFGTELPLYAA